jgi:hypothetical protein
MLPQVVTVIVNQLASPAGIEAGDAAGQQARAARQAEAEFLADYIQARQTNDPAEAIVVVGGYNAFAFNDGYVDVVGTIRGVPAASDQVATASPDLVSPDLEDAGAALPDEERYSFVFQGNAQALDHVLHTANLIPQVAGVARPRVSADFPEAWRSDATTPARLSDRDPAVAYFSFPPDVDAPVFDFAPQNQTAEATSPDGARVSFSVPTATDNLDTDVSVTCQPASGATFPIGNTGVTCTASDDAGNTAEASFTITVTEPVAGRLLGAGHVVAADGQVWFALDVREAPLYRERGWMVLMIRAGRDRPNWFVSAKVRDIRFTDEGGGVMFTGTGWWNGRPGYTVEVMASDNGEPGRGRDAFSVVVKSPSGEVLIGMSNVLRDGNVQRKF